jgi:hypothetical protein
MLIIAEVMHNLMHNRIPIPWVILALAYKLALNESHLLNLFYFVLALCEQRHDLASLAI